MITKRGAMLFARKSSAGTCRAHDAQASDFCKYTA
jgi:hypothetical protein